MFGVTQPDGTEVQESIYSMSKSIYIIVLVYRVTFRDSELLRPGLCPEGETQIKWSKTQLKMNTFTPQIQKQRRV